MWRIIPLALLVVVLIPTLAFAQKLAISSDSAIVEELGRASRLYLQGKLGECIPHYRVVFDRELVRPTLTRTFWRVLVDNLGMAYGITGELDSAEHVFRQGIARDSTYPLFYYNLACTYAERGDLDNAMRQLRIAYGYKANMNEGESFPNPATDDSFQRFMRNEKFVQFLEDMKRD
jgi:tetratricopeptide (TPR) repeat protein